MTGINIFKSVQVCVIMTIFFYGLPGCTPKTASPNHNNQLQQELATIDSLLKNEAFAESIAKTLDSSWYVGEGKLPQQFLTAADDTAWVVKRMKDEKIATNLAGFYALECGVGLLIEQTNQSPVVLMQKITDGTADTNAILLLNRFANATWKAGQPFRALNRITRYNFTGAGALTAEEVDKDYVQVKSAATKLLPLFLPLAADSLQQQMQLLRKLLQDTVFATEMASHQNTSYAQSQGNKTTAFSTPQEDTATLQKSVKALKIATNLAGFYALECGLNYLVTKKNQLPSVILTSLLNGSLNKQDEMIFARFANATWKAGQPFREIKRITRTTFTPFYFLTNADIKKDMVQVKAAAARLLPLLKS